MRPVEQYGHVAVFCGGRSRERDISLQTGQAVNDALLSAGVQVSMIDTAEDVLNLSDFDRGFVALHGRDGEDGKFQALLEYAGLPYTGSDVASSSLSMNKWHSKAVWQSVDVATPDYQVVGGDLELHPETLSFPAYVKPVNEGSSIGITCVSDVDELNAAIAYAREFDEYVLIELAVNGQEYTWSTIDDQPEFPLICLQSQTAFYDYEAKYLRDDTQYIVDPELDESVKCDYVAQAKKAFTSLGLSGWGRVDFMVDEKGKAWFIEANSVPGMTSHSLVPKAAAGAGLDFPEVCLAILETSYDD